MWSLKVRTMSLSSEWLLVYLKLMNEHWCFSAYFSFFSTACSTTLWCYRGRGCICHEKSNNVMKKSPDNITGKTLELPKYVWECFDSDEYIISNIDKIMAAWCFHCAFVRTLSRSTDMGSFYKADNEGADHAETHSCVVRNRWWMS